MKKSQSHIQILLELKHSTYHAHLPPTTRESDDGSIDTISDEDSNNVEGMEDLNKEEEQHDVSFDDYDFQRIHAATEAED
jgi:hypothetical protein